MHQKGGQSAQPSSATPHVDDDNDEDENPSDPFADTEEDLDDDNDGDGRGSWWRDVVKTRGPPDGNDSDDEREGEDEDEFGDFAMAEEDKAGGDKVLLKPLAVNPAKESSRGLSGLWPFSSKNDKDKDKDKQGGEGSREQAVDDDLNDGNEKQAVEVKAAKRRTSIEEPDDEEVVV